MCKYTVCAGDGQRLEVCDRRHRLGYEKIQASKGRMHNDRDDQHDAASGKTPARSNGDFDTTDADATHTKFEGHAELVRAVFSAHLVVYHDQWNNRRTLEARAYGIGRGPRHVLIGFQIDADRGVEPEQLWKSIDDLDRVYSIGETYASGDRIVPAHHTGQVVKIIALAPQTGWEQVPHLGDDD
jgi:hypothetical protein